MRGEPSVNTSQDRIAALEQQLAAAREEERVERRENWIRQLRETRKALKQAYKTYLNLSKQIKLEDQLKAAHTRNIQRLDAAVSDHMRKRPIVADYLPDDEDVVAWKARLQELNETRDRQIELRNAVPTTNRLEAIQYEGEHGIIAQLERAQTQLVNAIDESTGKLTGGGIDGVL